MLPVKRVSDLTKKACVQVDLCTFALSDDAAGLFWQSLDFVVDIEGQDLQGFVFIKTTLYLHLMPAT